MGEIWKELSAISRELSAELRMETRPAPGSRRVSLEFFWRVADHILKSGLSDQL